MHRVIWSKIRQVFTFVIVLGCIGCAAEPQKREKKDSVTSVDQPPNVTQTASTGDSTVTTAPVNPDLSTDKPLTFPNQPLNLPARPDGYGLKNLPILINKVFPGTTWQFEPPVPLGSHNGWSINGPPLKTVSFTGTPNPKGDGSDAEIAVILNDNGSISTGNALAFSHHGGNAFGIKPETVGNHSFIVTAAGTAEITFSAGGTPPKVYIFKRIK